jgi:uncharacterized protein (DUF1501 family)
MKSNSVDPTRRDFLRRTCCAAVGTTGMLSALAQLRMLGAVAADSLDVPARAAAVPADYKALVCLFLSGGNDATNLIIPSDASSYAAYARARSELAISQANLRPIVARKYADGRSYALHPLVPGIQSLFADGKLAFLANVGTLVQPTTLSQFQAGRALPPQLFSHSDQLYQWQSSIGERPLETGWGGRVADLVNAMNSNNQISMSITLSGTNRFQIGNTVAQYAINTGGAARMSYGSGVGNGARTTAIRNLMSNPQPNLLAAAFGGATTSAMADSELLSEVLRTAPTLGTVFPSTQTADRLKIVARMISVASELGLKRQIFFVQLYGWDLHAGQVEGHGPLLAETSGALKAFYDATVELGVANQVTTFTASDFGRTYTPNAGGTDHGWGNHQLIMGGAVQGGDIYGKMPSLTVGADDDTGRGRWIPSTSVDEYNATLATWFGVSASNLPVVLPNIGRFAKPNLGFMG